MTKFEWERQLKNGISGLPNAEQKRVLDYYEELFSDKIDAGMSEENIIAEFGNPYNVANKILVDFYNDGKDNLQADEYIYTSAEKTDNVFDNNKSNAAPAVNETKNSKETSSGKSKNKEDVSTKSVSGLVALSCVLIFFVLGACFNWWHPAWLIFLLMPVIVSLIDAISKKSWRHFNYPVFVTFLYLALGFGAHLWHPTWVLFITIPLYYSIGAYVSKNSDETKTKRESSNESQKVANENKSSGKKSGAGNVIVGIIVTCVLVWLMFVVWSCVISLFCAGIGMLVGGVAVLIAAFIALVSNVSLGMLTLGAALIVLGLGLLFTFGMASLFKPCVKMCKEFVKTIKSSFGVEE